MPLMPRDGMAAKKDLLGPAKSSTSEESQEPATICLSCRNRRPILIGALFGPGCHPLPELAQR